jgi:hypothetical protein
MGNGLVVEKRVGRPKPPGSNDTGIPRYEYMTTELRSPEHRRDTDAFLLRVLDLYEHADDEVPLADRAALE